MSYPQITNIIRGESKVAKYIEFYESETTFKQGKSKLLSVENFTKRYPDIKIE